MTLNENFVDLHVHTNFSDSTFSPKEVVLHAIKSRLRAIAITDHDCVDGVGFCLEAAAGQTLEIIPGVELTAEINDIEVHIIGLLIDWNIPWFLKKLEQIRNDRVLRMQKMIKKLNNLGVDISEDEIYTFSTCEGSVGRPHLARALLEKGAVKSIQDAFWRYLGEDKPCYVKRLRVSPEEAIGWIKELNGIPILAHPGIRPTDEFIPELVHLGLMGIEAFHTDHSEKTVRYYKKLAKKYNLLISGGSDCHGMGKTAPLMGKVKVPEEVLEKLKEAKKQVL